MRRLRRRKSGLIARDDFREPRDWARPWADPPGWGWCWTGCCPSPRAAYYYYYNRPSGPPKVLTDCCANTIPQHLTMSITSPTDHVCDCMIGTYGMDWIPDIENVYGSSGTPGHVPGWVLNFSPSGCGRVIRFFLTCRLSAGVFVWKLDQFAPTPAVCAPFIGADALFHQCSPLILSFNPTFDASGGNCCDGSIAHTGDIFCVVTE